MPLKNNKKERDVIREISLSCLAKHCFSLYNPPFINEIMHEYIRIHISHKCSSCEFFAVYSRHHPGHYRSKSDLQICITK